MEVELEPFIEIKAVSVDPWVFVVGGHSVKLFPLGKVNDPNFIDFDCTNLYRRPGMSRLSLH